MKFFLRLLSFSLRYRWRFVTGVFVSFLVASLNGVSLTMFIPLFEALGNKDDEFRIQLSEQERTVLDEAIRRDVLWLFATETQPPQLIGVKERVNKDQARLIREILDHRDEWWYFGQMSRPENLQLNTIIQAKLFVNESAWRPRTVVFISCLLFLPLWSIKVVFFLISVRLIARTGYMAVRDIRRKLYEHVQRLPLTYFYRERSGELVSRLVNDVEIVAAVISSNLRDAITNVFFIITHVVLLAYLRYELLLVSVLVVPIILSPVTLFTRKIRKSIHKSQELLAGLHGHLNESISGVRVIRGAAKEQAETENFRHVNERLYWRTFKQVFYLRMAPNLVELNSTIVALGILALGAAHLDETEFTRGELITFFIVLLFIIRPIIQLSGMYAKVQAASAAGKRIFGVMGVEPESVDPVKPAKLERLKDSIRFENVQFTYPGTDKAVLHDINLTVPVGSTVALVGESGGGKSTMMDLLARFFLPTGGRILLDETEIRDFRVKDHRSRIGIVQQDTFLFYGSIFQNIAYGSPNHDRDEVEKAARLAYAHDFIKDFYEGYQTLVGNRGATLSGGQRQRISIARALLHDPEILILDEATSALDTESERLVQQALDRLFMNRTTFVIAHRLSTIEKADMIVVIQDGRIVDQGSHEDLMKREGLYSRLQEISRNMDDFVINQ